MRKYLVIQKILEYISRRKINFFLTTLLIVVTLYMTSMVIHMYVKSIYYMVQTKEVFSDENILNIQILMDNQENDNYYENVDVFFYAMKDRYGDNFGKFMYLTVNYIIEGKDENLDTLYLDESLFDLCKVDFHIDSAGRELLEKDVSLIPGFVSKGNLNKYPIGTILQNSNINTKTVIVGYFDDDARWAPGLLLHSQNAAIDLNNYIVSGMDNQYFAFQSMFYANTFNSIYVKTGSRYDIFSYKEEIREIAQKFHVKCYIYTVDELINEEKQENKTLMSALGMMVGFAVFVALAGILSSYLADVGSWQKEIAIMYLNGVAPGDVYFIILLENLIKVVLGLNIAFYLYGHKLSLNDYEIYWSKVVPILISGTLIFVVLFSYIAFKTVKQRKLLNIYGGSRL